MPASENEKANRSPELESRLSMEPSECDEYSRCRWSNMFNMFHCSLFRLRLRKTVVGPIIHTAKMPARGGVNSTDI